LKGIQENPFLKIEIDEEDNNDEDDVEEENKQKQKKQKRGNETYLEYLDTGNFYAQKSFPQH
jgi:hypothetical protein